MCGLIALLGPHVSNFNLGILQSGLNQMYRRGPEAQATWQEPGVQLGHCRLAIQDLEIRSNQPMHSACGRFVIVFNGEIYNFKELRSELISKGVHFQTVSDTEVVLALFVLEGAAMLSHLRGMFAIVIWDRISRRAFAARDPYGIKPLYWAQTANGLLLASQVQALLATGLVGTKPCARGQASYWLLGSVAEPNTWYQDIKALQAGHYVWITDGRMGHPQLWWDVKEAWRSAPCKPPPIGEVLERTRIALQESIKAHLVADVPVGVFLSGGIDSGALAGLMVEAGARNLQGITLSYDEFVGTHQDEALPAAILARHYGIAHHVRRITRAEFEADLPRILSSMDQPSVDGINTWYASKTVAELGLKVVVSGIGGDELFQGYNSFKQLPRLIAARRIANKIPGAQALVHALGNWQARRSGNVRWQHLADWTETIAGAWFLRRGLFAPSELPSLMGKELAALGLQGFNPDVWLNEMCGVLSASPMLALSQIESTTYMLNQLLRDSDWASMDHSVELRTPLVDAWLLRDLQPMLSAFNKFHDKRLLAEAPGKPLPEALINRSKTGFSIPVQTWLKQIFNSDCSLSSKNSWARYVASQSEQKSAIFQGQSF